MISTATFLKRVFFFPLGNTPATCLTQDLPPNRDADILLLGCGDVRNILLTCFTDINRKMDVTCCDSEPLIHARNILLYSLLIEDKGNANVERIWNIYFHWRLDKESLRLLESQIQKLLRVSNSLEEWDASVYGSVVRFCNEISLSNIRSYWECFRFESLSPADKKRRLNQMQTLLNSVKELRHEIFGDEHFSTCGIDVSSPVGYDAVMDVAAVNFCWWERGIVWSNSQQPTDLNPAFLGSPNPAHMLDYSLEPLLGLPLSPAFTPIKKGSLFYLGMKKPSTPNAPPNPAHVVKCAKNLFTQWALAFRKAIRNKLIIRIFCGDALELCVTLHSRELTEQPDQSNVRIATPSKFDIIDTSNLLDYVGPVNLIAAASSVLKDCASSCLYTEMMIFSHSNHVERLYSVFGVDARSMSALLGLASPDLFTNARNSFDKDPLSCAISSWSADESVHSLTQYLSRLRWKRAPGYKKFSIHVEAKALADFLMQVHNAMFKHEDLRSLSKAFRRPEVPRELIMPRHNRASFAFLLSLLRTNIVCDWDQCVEHIFNRIFALDASKSVTPMYEQDLLVNMHLYGIDSRRLALAHTDIRDAVLAPYLPVIENMPLQLCVTVRVPRKNFKFIDDKKADISMLCILTCSIHGCDPGEWPWSNTFSTVRVAFGTWHDDKKSHPFIEKDSSQLFGTSDMFASFFVPTIMLLRAKRAVPSVNVGFIVTSQAVAFFRGILGEDLCFSRSEMTSKDVFITEYMPGMSTLPGLPSTSTRQSHQDSMSAVTVQFSNDKTKIETLTRRITLESQEAKDELANQSSKVEVKFKSPLTASVLIGQSRELKFEFPVPVSCLHYKLRIARKSSYIEIEAHLFDPLREDASKFIFPTLITKTLSGATVPIPWASSCIDLDVLPPVDHKDANSLSWMLNHASLMFSERERKIHKSSMANRSFLRDTRTDVKDGLFSIFMHYIGLRGEQSDVFALSTTNGSIKMLIFPSCLRLDLTNHTVVLDAAVIPKTDAMLNDLTAVRFFKELASYDLCQVIVSEGEDLAWKAMLPALVERCRTATSWEHTSNCEYIKAGQTVVSAEGISPICSCGIDKFPLRDYLKSQKESLPSLNHMIKQYAVRCAIAPIFAVLDVENCYLSDFREKVGPPNPNRTFWEELATFKRYFLSLGIYNKEKCISKEKCAKCGKSKGENGQLSEEKLLWCGKCKMVKYCSRECQTADWKKHKALCSAAA